MSVYIQGMEMPTEGTVIAIYKLNGKFYASVHGTELCPLIPVPDHGRLGDLDELEKAMRNRKNYIGRWSDAECLVADAPTIILADKENNCYDS